MDVLLVDDEPAKRLALQARLERAGHAVRCFERAEPALEAALERPPDALVTDLRLPGRDGLWLLAAVRERIPAAGVILITAYGSIDNAVQAMQAGAFDYLAKPFAGEELLLRLERLARHQRQAGEVRALRSELARRDGLEGLIGASPAFERLASQIRAVAAGDAPVLLVGESGTGKERVARAIHQASARRDGPFVALSCAELSPALAESELFGHEAGAFTGATGARPGRLEQARGGTLLLDDADDIPLELQPKLLRALQEWRVRRVGGQQEVPLDLRLVSASKLPLERLVEQGRFRQDLFFRLAVVEIALPPLRERPADVPLLAAHFLERLRERDPELPARRFSAAALRRLADHRWPGNLRQLANAVAHAATFCGGPEIGPEHLPDDVGSARRLPPDPLPWLAAREQVDFNATLRACEAQLLDWALERAGGNQVRAARLLGLPRSTLQSRLTRRNGR